MVIKSQRSAVAADDEDEDAKDISWQGDGFHPGIGQPEQNS
jgi:hypothetical protein